MVGINHMNLEYYHTFIHL